MKKTKKHSSISRLFATINSLTIFFLLLSGFFAFQIAQKEAVLNKAHQKRMQSIQLAYELKQSSESLTSMARAFVCTADTAFENRYNEILDIRNGKIPRPDGQIIPLKELMQRSGVTEQEFEKLRESERKSNELAETETIAMNLIKGLQYDGFGGFVPTTDIDSAYARRLVFNTAYFQAKHEIIQPIEEFFEMIDNRTQATVNQIHENIRHIWLYLFISIIMAVALQIFSYFGLKRSVLQPINAMYQHARQLAVGNYSAQLHIEKHNEVGRLAKQFKKMSDGLKDKERFVREIGKGILDSKFTPLSEQDKMGQSLLDMRQSLQQTREEEEKRKLEDYERNWTTEGLAMFSDILRKDNDNLKKLSDNINTNMVKYLEADVGGLFIINDKDKEDVYIELMSAFAYNRQRSEHKRLEVDEGLIGRCITESETIYMTQIPDEYMDIVSGLGGSNPQNLLIVPLKVNEEIFGVIEIASFKEIKPYQIQFVEKIGESIASTISSAKINAQTAELLELAQENAEEMAAQEEEMRQNFEELEATQEALDAKDKQQQKVIERLNRQNEEKIQQMLEVQEQMEAKETEMQGVLRAINSSSLSVEYDLDGFIINANDKYATTLDLSIDEIIGNHHKHFAKELAKGNEEYLKFWNDLRAGLSKRIVNMVEVNDEKIWLSETYTPILNKEGQPYKVINLAQNVTGIKEQELKMQRLLQDSEEKAKALRKQEDELKQNIEKLEKIKEHLAQKEEEQKQRIDDLNTQNEQKIKEIETIKENEAKKIREIQNTQRRVLEKAISKAKEKETIYKQQIAECEERLEKLRNKANK